jgi:predicted peptidase
VLATGRRAVVSGNVLQFEDSGNEVTNGTEANWDTYKIFDQDPTLMQSHVYVNANRDTLPYRLMTPAAYDTNAKYPLILFMHGFGEQGNDNREQIRHFLWQLAVEKTRDQYPCFVLAPQRPQGDSSWLKSAVASTDWINESTSQLMTQLQQQYSIDSNRIYVIGISSGGTATWEYIIQQPKKFAAAVPVSCYVTMSPEHARRIKNMPIWAFNGDEDEQLPKVFTRLWMGVMQREGPPPRLTEFKKSGHLCWDRIYEVPEFLPWLFAQRRSQ